MCGIVAAIGAADHDVVPALIEGLKRLEYRGYDSAGLAVLAPQLHRLRTPGRVGELESQAARDGVRGPAGIAHTRWATHGVPSERNAHPHMAGRLAIVHNGIIENFAILKSELIAQGHLFSSETDSEVIAHLIAAQLQATCDLLTAVRLACRRLVGAYALAVLYEDEPSIVLARHGAPLLLGLAGEGKVHYAASDAQALIPFTRQLVLLEDGDFAQIEAGHWQVVDGGGHAVVRPPYFSQLSLDAVELGHYRHYMQKEIFEQPAALAATLELIGGASEFTPQLFGSEAAERLAGVRQVLILGCGTSFHAGLTARYWIEQLSGLPCSVEIASEYRYRIASHSPDTLVVAISQSGETADLLAAVYKARELGMKQLLALCNVAESSLVRLCPLRFLTRAGPEIGVASTKAFTTQLAALFLLANVLAKRAGRLDAQLEAEHLAVLRHLPLAVHKVLALETQITAWAERFADKHHALFLGRGRHYPIALEGALKLKEISYIHAEGYPAGELKHGPLALVDREMPVIAVAPNDALLEKLKSNLEEVRARGGELYVFADADSHLGESAGVHLMRLPEHYGLLSPVLHVVPLQLLAYHVALVKGTDVDKPRNLAKSVTVE